MEKYNTDIPIEGSENAENMSVNEALRKLSRDGAEFFVFRNSEKESQPLTIAYMRDSGDCGILET